MQLNISPYGTLRSALLHCLRNVDRQFFTKCKYLHSLPQFRILTKISILVNIFVQNSIFLWKFLFLTEIEIFFQNIESRHLSIFFTQTWIFEALKIGFFWTQFIIEIIYWNYILQYITDVFRKDFVMLFWPPWWPYTKSRKWRLLPIIY